MSTIEQPSPSYRPASGRVALLSVLFSVFALLSLAAVWSSWSEIGLLEDARAGHEITDERATANDLRQGVIGLAQIALYIGMIIAFCMWVHRANVNARALGAEGMQYTPGWSVGWFFVPIANLYKPYQAVKEIWTASEPDPSASGPRSGAAPLVGAWWFLWIAACVVDRVAGRMTFQADTIDQMLAASWTMLASSVVMIPLSICAMLVVRGIHDRQERKSISSMGGRTFGIPDPAGVAFRPV